MHRSTATVLGTTLLALSVTLWAPELGLVGCASNAQAGKQTEHLLVFFSNETENELYRCGCTSNQMGGLSRRATVFAQQSDYPELVVDAGNFSPTRPDSVYDSYKQDYLLRIYEMLGYHALNAGPQEFMRGKEKLLSLAEDTGNRMVSANIIDADKQLVLPPYRVVTIEGLKVGIIGLITEQFIPNPANPADSLSTLDAQEAFGQHWEALKKESDFQVLLSQLRDDQVDILTNSYPGIDLIIGGPGWQQAEMAPKEVNKIPYAKVGVRGRFVGQISLDLKPLEGEGVVVDKYEGTVVPLNDKIANNERVEQVLAEFKENLRTGKAERDGVPVWQDTPDAHGIAPFRYAGAQSCQTCHGQIYAGWTGTRHAQALQTLQKDSEEKNPECLECHTVGYGEAGGYAAKGAPYALANVQCENCHGPAADHVSMETDLKEGLVVDVPAGRHVETIDTPAATCLQCHTPDNDPHWNADETVWPYEELRSKIVCSQWLTGATAGQAPAAQH